MSARLHLAIIVSKGGRAIFAHVVAGSNGCKQEVTRERGEARRAFNNTLDKARNVSTLPRQASTSY